MPTWSRVRGSAPLRRATRAGAASGWAVDLRRTDRHMLDRPGQVRRHTRSGFSCLGIRAVGVETLIGVTTERSDGEIRHELHDGEGGQSYSSPVCPCAPLACRQRRRHHLEGQAHGHPPDLHHPRSPQVLACSPADRERARPAASPHGSRAARPCDPDPERFRPHHARTRRGHRDRAPPGSRRKRMGGGPYESWQDDHLPRPGPRSCDRTRHCRPARFLGSVRSPPHRPATAPPREARRTRTVFTRYGGPGRRHREAPRARCLQRAASLRVYRHRSRRHRTWRRTSR
jgi:hypothetical protein